MSRKNKDRRMAMSIFNDLYSDETFGNRLVCAYCGDVREGVDHIPPISTVWKIGTKELRKRGVQLIRVPCCKTCNSTLSDRKLGTYGERLVFLYENLQTKLDRSVMWSKSEIDENLTGELKRIVTARQRNFNREWLVRLRGMESRLISLQNMHIDELI